MPDNTEILEGAERDSETPDVGPVQDRKSSIDPKTGAGANRTASAPAGSGKTGSEGNGDKQPEKPKSRLGLIIFGFVLLAAAVGAFIWWERSSRYENTDDAQVSAHLSGISARIAGTVTAVYVEENQFVKEGQVIADLDPRDYLIALDQAQSELVQSRAQVNAANPNVPITQTTNQATVSSTEADLASAEAGIAAAQGDFEAAQADLREAEANAAKAQADVARYEPLVAKDEVPRQQYDQVVATAKAQAALVDSKRAAAAAAQKTIDQRIATLNQTKVRVNEAKQNAPLQLALRRADIVTRQAGVKTSATQVARAQLDLSYTKIISPVSGMVSRRSVEVGQHVNPGQQIVQIAQIGDLWVTANFKETQLRRMRAGQRATIHVDAYKSDFEGHVESLPASTGSITSLLPPENATGNYVKVTQRLPVRIRFEPNQPGLDRLRPGMSVDPKVWVE